MCSLCLICPQSHREQVTFSWFLCWALSPVQAPGSACRAVALRPLVTDALVVAGGGDVKIESQKLNFKEKAQAKVGSLDNVGHLPAGGAVKVVSGHDRDAAGRGGVVESGSQQVGAVTAPRSPQESCFLLTVAVFSSSVISRGRGRRGGGPGWRQPSPETMACLTF